MVATDNDFDSDNKERAIDILEQIESVLPTAEEHEDALSLHGALMELHGREAVKYRKTRNPKLAWKRSCGLARLLLHFDFLSLGILKSPLLNR